MLFVCIPCVFQVSSIVGGHSCWQWEVCLAILAPLFADRLLGNHPNFHNRPNATTSNNPTIPVVVGSRLFNLLQKLRSIINTTTTTIIPSSKIQTSCLISRGFLTESFHKPKSVTLQILFCILLFVLLFCTVLHSAAPLPHFVLWNKHQFNNIITLTLFYWQGGNLFMLSEIYLFDWVSLKKGELKVKRCFTNEFPWGLIVVTRRTWHSITIISAFIIDITIVILATSTSFSSSLWSYYHKNYLHLQWFLPVSTDGTGKLSVGSNIWDNGSWFQSLWQIWWQRWLLWQGRWSESTFTWSLPSLYRSDLILLVLVFVLVFSLVLINFNFHLVFALLVLIRFNVHLYLYLYFHLYW